MNTYPYSNRNKDPPMLQATEFFGGFLLMTRVALGA